MINDMTFCASVQNKEKLGVPSFILCTDSVLDAYVTRVLSDSGTIDDIICTRNYIDRIINT